MDHTKWQNIGRVGKALGLRGECYVVCHPRLEFEKNQEVRVGASLKSSKVLLISGHRLHKNRHILKFKEINDRTSIEKYDKEDLWLEVYSSKNKILCLLGYRVFDKNMTDLGKVSNFYNHGAGDNIELSHELKGTLEIPFNQEFFEIDKIDHNAQKIIMTIDIKLFEELWTNQ